VIHQDRRRAGSFGEAAEQYERARPSYPVELVDALMADHPGRVLDVGCGTGKAGRLFAVRGHWRGA
jgi:trans-aconitate methyltransferase